MEEGLRRDDETIQEAIERHLVAGTEASFEMARRLSKMVKESLQDDAEEMDPELAELLKRIEQQPCNSSSPSPLKKP